MKSYLWSCMMTRQIKYNRPPGGWVGGSTPGNSSGGVLLGSPNPDPISDQKISFSPPIFRPDILSPYPFSDLAFRHKLCHNYIIILECKQKI